MTHNNGKDQCVMSIDCIGKPADHGLMCAEHRAEDREIERMFTDDVDPAQRPMVPLRVVGSPTRSRRMSSVENITRALRDTLRHHGVELHPDDVKGLAIDALMAMRGPTMTMLNAAVDRTGAGSDMSWSNRSPQGLFEAAHRAMIDAAIGEG